MNFFRDKELAERFAADNVSEREMFYYFLISGLIVSLFTSTSFTSLIEIEVTIWDYILDVILIITSIIGSVWVYGINTKGDNKNFIARFISLSFPIGVKCTILLILLLVPVFALVILNEEVYNKTLISNNGLEAIIGGVFLLAIFYYYLRLAYSMKIASKPAS